MPFLEEPPHHAKNPDRLADRVALWCCVGAVTLIIMTTLFVLSLYGVGILH